MRDVALIGNIIPKTISPAINVSFVVVSQYSISPYLLTFKRLKTIGMTRKMVMSAEDGTNPAVGQN